MAHELTKIDIDLWEKMKALDEPTLKSVLGQWLSAIEIRAILERREMMERKINNLMGGAAFFPRAHARLPEND